MDHADIVEIQQLISFYGHAVDEPDQRLLPLVFTTDAVFIAPFGRYEGLEAISAWFALGKPPHPPSHHVTNVCVHDVDGEVRVRSKWFVVDRNTGTASTGDYEDIVVKTAAGWRIKHRLCFFRFPSLEEVTKRRNAERQAASMQS